MSLKITKKVRKAKRSLIIQKARVQKIENILTDFDPVECPVVHRFTDNEEQGLNIYCREFLVPAGTVVTGTIYKIECFWTLMYGKMRLVEGNHTREIEGPCLLKNVVNAKNAGYAHTDCLFYGFMPNPENSRDLEQVINVWSEIDAKELQGMPLNKQQLNYQKRLSYEIN